MRAADNEHEGLGRPSTGVHTCSECGTTIMSFDPPLHFESIPHGEPCGATKPGTYGTGPAPVPVCDMNAGHDGQHIAEITYLDRWSS